MTMMSGSLAGGEYLSNSTSVDSTERLNGRWGVMKVNNCRMEDRYISSSDDRILSGEDI